MHITTLRTGQVFNSYMAAGTNLHLSVGTIMVSEAPSWGDAHGFLHETLLNEGGIYQVQRSGWLLIKARRDAELLTEVIEPTWLLRSWIIVRQLALDLLPGALARLFVSVGNKISRRKALNH